MPDWFYPVMLVVILAGYVFLFLQGRAAREATTALETQIDGLRRMLAEDRGALGTPRVPELPATDDFRSRLDDVQRLVAGHGAALERLAEAVERLEIRWDGASAGEAVSPGGSTTADLEAVARDFLIGEGCSSITFMGSAAVDEGVRIGLRALRGNEVRHGHVIVRDGRVVDAALEVPTTLFP